MKNHDECDVLIIGAGATGALAAAVLAKAGLDVVCLEQGGWVEPNDHPHYSSDWTWQRRTNWSPDVNKRRRPDDYPVETNSSQAQPTSTAPSGLDTDHPIFAKVTSMACSPIGQFRMKSSRPFMSRRIA